MNLYRQADCGPLDLDMTVGDILGVTEDDFTDEYEDGSDAVADVTDATLAPVDDVAAADAATAALDVAPAAARVQQDTQGDIGTLNAALQTGLTDSEATFQQMLTQGEGMFDNTVNTVETATGLGDSDVGGAARIQQTAADVTTDVNAAVEDASHAFDATIEGANAQLDTLMSAFAPAGAAPAAAAARRLQRFS
jgi:hypothetical protein